MERPTTPPTNSRLQEAIAEVSDAFMGLGMTYGPLSHEAGQVISYQLRKFFDLGVHSASRLALDLRTELSSRERQMKHLEEDLRALKLENHRLREQLRRA